MHRVSLCRKAAILVGGVLSAFSGTASATLFGEKSSPQEARGAPKVARTPPWSHTMNLHTHRKPPLAEAQPAVFLRIAGVMRMTGLGRSTIYRLMAEDKFPPPVRLAKRAVAWRRIDLEQWSAERPLASH
jgi:prophage regulatory protein